MLYSPGQLVTTWVGRRPFLSVPSYFVAEVPCKLAHRIWTTCIPAEHSPASGKRRTFSLCVGPCLASHSVSKTNHRAVLES